MTKREKELEDLFQRWMKKQGEEKGWEKTTVGGREILRIHFTKDGMVDPEAYEVSSCKILVVLKEANIADNMPRWHPSRRTDPSRSTPGGSGMPCHRPMRRPWNRPR